MSENTIRVAVIGSNGGIGARLAEYLSKTESIQIRGLDMHHDSRVVLNDGYLQTDLLQVLRGGPKRDELSSFMENVDAVVLLAGAVHDKRLTHSDYQQLNVDVPAELFQILSKTTTQPVRFIFASTIAVYGEMTECAYTEAEPAAPVTDYASSKLQAENKLKELHLVNDQIEPIFLRFGTLINKEDRGNLKKMVTAASRYRLLPRIRRGIKKSFVDIDDVCRAIAKCVAAEKMASNTYNIVGPVTDLADVLDLVATAAKVRVRLFFPHALLRMLSPTMSHSVSVSSERSNRDLGMSYSDFESAFRKEFMENSAPL